MSVDHDVVARLRSARGHLDAVVRMAEEGRDCLTILHQLGAVEGALVQSRRAVLESHLHDCLLETLADGRTDDLVDEILIATFGGSIPPTRMDDR